VELDDVDEKEDVEGPEEDVDEEEDVEGPEELRVGLVRDTKEGRDEDSDDCGGKKVLATPPMTVPRPKGLVFALEGV